VTSIPLDSVTNLTPPGYLVIDPDDPLKREYIFYTDINALVLENVSRGLEGSAAGVPQEHGAGARVRAVSVHQWLNDIFSDIEDLEDGTSVIPTYLATDGGNAMAANLDMGGGGFRIVDMGNGIADQDGATVKQVGDRVAKAGDTMTGPLVIQDAAGGQLTLEDPGGAAPDASIISHDEGILKLGALLTLDNVSGDVIAGSRIQVDTGATQKAIYSISQIELGQDTDGGGAGRTSFLDMHAGGGFDQDVRLLASSPGVAAGQGLFTVTADRVVFSKDFQLNGESVVDLNIGGNQLLDVANGVLDTDGVNWNQVKTQSTDTSAAGASGFTGTVAFRREGRFTVCTIALTRAAVTLNGPFDIVTGIPAEFQSVASTVFANVRTRFVTVEDTNEYKTALLQMSAGASKMTIETRIELCDTIKATFAYIGNGP
jgi:hypothetical protein